MANREKVVSRRRRQVTSEAAAVVSGLHEPKGSSPTLAYARHIGDIGDTYDHHRDSDGSHVVAGSSKRDDQTSQGSWTNSIAARAQDLAIN
jgi:hypothetical protein